MQNDIGVVYAAPKAPYRGIKNRFNAELASPAIVVAASAMRDCPHAIHAVRINEVTSSNGMDSRIGDSNVEAYANAVPYMRRIMGLRKHPSKIAIPMPSKAVRFKYGLSVLKCRCSGGIEANCGYSVCMTR